MPMTFFTSFKPDSDTAAAAISNLEDCIKDVHQWLCSHSLKLNFSKCEFVLYGSKTHLSKVQITSISIANHITEVSDTCRNLGVFLDSNMTMGTHIQYICKSVRYQLRNLGFIRKYLTLDATEKIVHSLISSRLDFGNALLFNLPQSQITRLQKLQNSAARIVTLHNKFTHITPVLKSLHWLPMSERVKFKILLLVYHSVHGSAPQYNTALINTYTPSRLLRSSDSGLLTVPKCKTKWGERAFIHAGPSLWNSLPREIRDSKCVETFKIKLKTYLYNSFYQ